MSVASSRPRGSNWHRPPERTALIGAIVLALVCLFGIGDARPAAAATQTSTARIALDPNAPAVSASGHAVSVSGTVTNTGASAITDPVVHVYVGDQLLDTRDAARSWAAGKLAVRLTQAATGRTHRLGAGSSTSFTVRIPGSKLRYDYGLASLPLSVTVTDGSAATGSTLRGTTRSSLQVQNSTVSARLGISVVIPLTLPADPALFGPTGSSRAAAWEAAVGPHSRIQRTLAAFAGLPVIFAVDPALLDPGPGADDNVPEMTASPSPSSSSDSSGHSGGIEATGSADGSSGQASERGGVPSAQSTNAPTPTGAGSGTGDATGGSSGSASSSPGSSSSSPSSGTAEPTTPDGRVAAASASLREQLTSLRSPNSVWWMPYDDPDLTTLRAKGRAGNALLRRDLRRAVPDTGLGRTRVVLPAGAIGGGAVRATTSELAKADKSSAVAVLPTRSLAATSAPSAASRVPGTSGVLTYDEGLSRIFSAPSTSPGTQTSRLLTELLALYQQAPGTKRSIALVAPRSAAADPEHLAAQVSALQSVGWVRVQSGAATMKALRSAPSRSLLATQRRGSAYPSTRSPALTAEQLLGLTRSRDSLSALQTVLVGGDDVLPARRQALDQIGSVRWRGLGAQLAAVAERDDSAVGAMLGKLSIRTSTINFFADSGDINVTVANQLNRPVRQLRLHLQPRTYLVRLNDSTRPIDIAANSRSTTRAHLKAVGGGAVRVDATLIAKDGTPLTDPDSPPQLQINVHPTSGWIMWVLGALAALILVVGLWRAIRRGPRTVTQPVAGDQPTPDEAIVDAGPPPDTAESTDEGSTHTDD